MQIERGGAMGRKRELSFSARAGGFWGQTPKSYVQVGTSHYPRERAKLGEIRTQADYDRFIDRSPGAVADYSSQMELFAYTETGKEIDPVKVKTAADELKGYTLGYREYPKQYVQNDIEQETGLEGKQALNAKAREQKAKAQAILLAARVGKVQLTPDQRGYLNAAAEGKFWEKVYGREGEYEHGILTTRMRGMRGTGRYSEDSGHRARTEELRERLREANPRGLTMRGTSTLNPFSQARKRASNQVASVGF